MSLIGRASLLGVVAALTSLSPLAAAPGPWKTLFDGRSTDAWRGYGRDAFPTDVWRVENGELKTIVGVKNPVDIITKDKYRDFELELEWKIKPGGNSGIIYRVAELPKPSETWHSGPEMQVLDDDEHKDGLDPKTSAGALYGLVAPTGKTLNPPGQRDKVRRGVNGRHVAHWLDGKNLGDPGRSLRDGAPPRDEPRRPDGAGEELVDPGGLPRGLGPRGRVLRAARRQARPRARAEPHDPHLRRLHRSLLRGAGLVAAPDLPVRGGARHRRRMGRRLLAALRDVAPPVAAVDLGGASGRGEHWHPRRVSG